MEIQLTEEGERLNEILGKKLKPSKWELRRKKRVHYKIRPLYSDKLKMQYRNMLNKENDWYARILAKPCLKL